MENRISIVSQLVQAPQWDKEAFRSLKDDTTLWLSGGRVHEQASNGCGKGGNILKNKQNLIPEINSNDNN